MPVLHSASEQTVRDRAADAFALWAEVYDEQPNPLLSLEEDFLSHLLPDVRGLDVVDMGCGTGRWLQRLASQDARSLIGIDGSREMIARAAAKVGRYTVLLRADCGSAALSADSADLCLASFLLSHVRDLEKFSRQLAYILRPGGTAFITDVHPGTSARLGWKRAFRYGDQSISLQTYERPIGEVIAALRKHGFQVSALLEPCFQTQQQRTLELHNSPLGPTVLRWPAIYILQVQRNDRPRASSRDAQANAMQITGSRVAFGPRASASVQLLLTGDSVSAFSTGLLGRSCIANAPSVDLSGYLLLPGLINSHDHLDFGSFPRLGRGGYRNASEWANDIQSRNAAVIDAHRRIPKPVRCWWGAIRNVLSGVTTVCHHNPVLPELLESSFPVRVLRDFEWAHSMEFDRQVPEKFWAANLEAPFIIHAAEGIDSNAAEEISKLERLGLLNQRTVLIHALALNEESVSLLNRSGAAVVWCPASNKFLFGRTHDLRVISSIKNLALGSDSSLTSDGGLLDDIAVARETGVAADRLYAMLYTTPARMFRMNRGEGTIRVGGVADLIAVEDVRADPADTLINLERPRVALVVVRGRVQLVRNRVRERLPQELCDGLEPLEVDGETVWLRAPVAQLSSAASEALHGSLRTGEGRKRYAIGN